MALWYGPFASGASEHGGRVVRPPVVAEEVVTVAPRSLVLVVLALVTCSCQCLIALGQPERRDRATKEPAEQEGRRVYQRAFEKGLAWIPAGNVLRMSPPLIM